MTSTRYLRLATVPLVAAALALSGCGSSSDSSAAPPPKASKPTGQITFWHFFTDREAEAIQSVVKDFEAANPGVTVVVKGGQDDEKMRQAISAGKGPDVGLSYSTDIVGNFCSTGAWRRPGAVARAGQGGHQPVCRPSASTRSTTGRAARCRCWPTRTASTTTRRCSPRPAYAAPPKTLERAQGDGASSSPVQRPDGRSRWPASCRRRATTRTPRHTWRPSSTPRGSRADGKSTIWPATRTGRR